MTDREEAGLRGLVKMCAVERDYVYPDHHWVMDTGDMFSREGNLLERRHRNPGGSHWSIMCRYDEHGRIRDKEYLGQAPDVEEVLSHQYDALGRLDRVIIRSRTDGERVFESFQYADDGTRTQTSYPTPLDDKKRIITGVMPGSMLHLSVDAIAIMTIFDASGHPARKVLYDADNRVIRRIMFRYNTRGLLLEEGELVGGRIREDFRNVYQYDAAGRQIEADMRCGDLGGQRMAFAYNERGDVTEERIEQRSSLSLGEEPAGVQSWAQRFRYQYDELGNWTERVTETVPSNCEASVSMIERRNLAYY